MFTRIARSRATRSAIGGCVENSELKPPPDNPLDRAASLANGLTM